MDLTLQSVQDILRDEISRYDYGPEHPIRQCGTAPLSILQHRPDEVLELAHERLHSFPYKDVPECWRLLYTEAALWKVLKLTDEDDWPSKVIAILDMVIIMTGAPTRKTIIELIFNRIYIALEFELPESFEEMVLNPVTGTVEGNCTRFGTNKVEQGRAPKRRKVTAKKNSIYFNLPSTFPQSSVPTPKLLYHISRTPDLSLLAFQSRITQDHKFNNSQGPLPFIITDCISHWPAVSSPTECWNNPAHLLRKTLGGRRLVPIEIGRSYTDNDWGQRIMLFHEFMRDYMLQENGRDGGKTGYLAQHDLFNQIQTLTQDIAIPDYCYSSPPSPFVSMESLNGKEGEEEDMDAEAEVKLNIWLGPGNTISPLHTDPHHNILAQVFGTKYVRLYAPSETARLYPRQKDAGDDDVGVDMSNTSQIDLDTAVALLEGRTLDGGESLSSDATYAEEERQEGNIEARREEFESQFPAFKDARYVEGILGPGECLFLPRGWWHYVRSLGGASCSVSFWWD